MSSTLTTNQFLMHDQFLMSPDGRHQFIHQSDGNVVLYRMQDHHPVWASGTNGRATSKLIMQQDGNLVLYGFPNALWASGTAGKPNSGLFIQNDGNAVIYEPNTPVWASDTAGQ